MILEGRYWREREGGTFLLSSPADVSLRETAQAWLRPLGGSFYVFGDPCGMNKSYDGRTVVSLSFFVFSSTSACSGWTGDINHIAPAGSISFKFHCVI